MAENFSYWHIPDDMLQADGKQRQLRVYVDKTLNLPPTIYQPLYAPISEKPVEYIPTVAVKLRVAIYELNYQWSKDHKFNEYVYQGDMYK